MGRENRASVNKRVNDIKGDRNLAKLIANECQIDQRKILIGYFFKEKLTIKLGL